LLRTITGFRQDEVGDWVAELSCLHGQHMRHRPPFQDRPWVSSAAGRAGRIGTDVDCALCDRAELPVGLVVVRTLGPFDEATIPAALRRVHRTPGGTWGLLQVLAGSLELRIDTAPPIERRLAGGDSQPIPPEVDHKVTTSGPVQLRLELLDRP
jgi:tellurite methyltransferase